MNNKKIAVIGLGYVGLPLAVEFSKKREVIGFDISKGRINDLKKGIDLTGELNKQELKTSLSIAYTSNLDDLNECTIFIITVPTPIDKQKKPDLTALKKSSTSIGKIIKKKDIVIYESTVYPGATEQICVPILEKESNFRYKKDFFCGYSPERINPGDKKHSLSNTIKITSGCDLKTGEFVDSLYNKIVTAGTYLVSSIAVAEAAKVIENVQRDVNIALVNELALIFNKIDLDTTEVLEAAGTKWNFLPFRPGLVGGHCIGVDPYYLTHKAAEVGYHPEMILAGRKTNDNMGYFIAEQTIGELTRKGISPIDAKIAILGLTFKENCSDIRNTKVVSIIHSLKSYKCKVSVVDHWADKNEAKEELNLVCLQAG